MKKRILCLILIIPFMVSGCSQTLFEELTSQSDGLAQFLSEKFGGNKNEFVIEPTDEIIMLEVGTDIEPGIYDVSYDEEVYPMIFETPKDSSIYNSIRDYGEFYTCPPPTEDSYDLTVGDVLCIETKTPVTFTLRK